jgi:hypothetical protein
MYPISTTRGCLFIRGDLWFIIYLPCTAALVRNKPTWYGYTQQIPRTTYIGVYTLYSVYTHIQPGIILQVVDYF